MRDALSMRACPRSRAYRILDSQCVTCDPLTGVSSSLAGFHAMYAVFSAFHTEHARQDQFCFERSEFPVVYAIVRAGGRQEKVAVGDLLTIDRVPGDAGSTIELPAVLLVDGDTVTSDAKTLSGVTVTAEVVEDLRGPKIRIQKYKNKTGYKKRQGFRAELTTVKVTGISA